MNERERTIRRAQAIHPYGPGAILDWGQECFAVMDTTRPGFKDGDRIQLERLSKRLGASEGFRQAPIVRDFFARTTALAVQRFPAWLFCPSCRRMYYWGREREVATKNAVPRCDDRNCRKSVLVPMRYVAVCDHGHLTEPEWARWAHSNRDAEAERCSAKDDLRFVSRNDRGSTLQALEVVCEKCKARQNLGRILERDVLGHLNQRCPGRQPWQAKAYASECDRPLAVLQRSQTAVHFGDVVSALDLQVGTSSTDEVTRALMDFVRTQSSFFEDSAELIRVMGQKILKKVRSDLGCAVDDTQLANVVRMFYRANDERVAGAAVEMSEQALLDEEWPALTTSTPREGKRGSLVVSKEQWPPSDDEALAGVVDSVYLVERLREVRAFRGFRRQDTSGPLVPPDLGREPPLPWLPAMEVFGEGIMLVLSNDALTNWERKYSGPLDVRTRQLAERIRIGDSPARRFVDHAEWLVRFITLHTFSHVLMRQLCYECGYGSASLRERLYAFEDRCGVLIYTAEGDSEGSLGGLVRQGRTDRIGTTIRAGLRRASWCSNDPICREMPAHGFSGLVRAACHACGYAPETSCTQLNSLLDRELLVADMGELRGFMTDLLE